MDINSCTQDMSELRFSSGRVIDVNCAFLEITCYKKKEVINKSLEEMEKLLKCELTLRTMDSRVKGENFIFSKELYPIHVKIHSMYDESSGDGIILFEKLLDNKFEDMFIGIEQIIKSNVSAVAIYHIPDYKILRANHKHMEFFYPACVRNEDFIGCKISELLTYWFDNDTRKIWNKVTETNEQYYEEEREYLCPNGNTMYISNNLIPVPVNGVVKYIIVISKNKTEDVLNRKYIEQTNKLIDSKNDNICNLLNIMDLPIVRVSYPEIKIISANSRILSGARKHFNINDMSSIVGKNINSFVPEFISSSHREHFFLMEKTQKSVNVDNCKISLTDGTYYFNCIFQPLFDEKNKINEMLVILLDVTHETQNKMDLEKILQTQEEFFSYIAHEFKTPLTVTYSALQLLDYFCVGELSERAKRFINKIRQSSLQQLRLVNNLLDITKADSGYLKLNRKNYDIVFMTEAIVNSVLTISKEKGIDIIFSSVVSEKNILIDDEKYERILLNILSNAIKFTPSGKSIYVNIFNENNYVNVKIKDEGAGIPFDKQEIIFDRFGQVNNGLTRSGEGTGIGLCLAKMLAKALGGDIILMSELGKGSEFTIQIPDVAASNISSEKQIHEVLEDRLIQSVNVEFSSIYQ